MRPDQELIDQLRRDDILQAKRMTPEQRLAPGGELFDMACEWSLAGIRSQCPGISEEAALAELRRRVRIADLRDPACDQSCQ